MFHRASIVIAISCARFCFFSPCWGKVAPACVLMVSTPRGSRRGCQPIESSLKMFLGFIHVFFLPYLNVTGDAVLWHAGKCTRLPFLVRVR